MAKECRTFFIIDDNSSNFYVGRFTRTQDEVKPELWALEPGEYLAIDTSRAYTRSSQRI